MRVLWQVASAAGKRYITSSPSAVARADLVQRIAASHPEIAVAPAPDAGAAAGTAPQRVSTAAPSCSRFPLQSLLTSSLLLLLFSFFYYKVIFCSKTLDALGLPPLRPALESLADMADAMIALGAVAPALRELGAEL